MTVQMVAIARTLYNQRSFTAGQDFDVPTDAEADDLEAVHMAVRKTPKPKKAAVQPPPAAPQTPVRSPEHSTTGEPAVLPKSDQPGVVTRDITGDGSEAAADQKAKANEEDDDTDEAKAAAVKQHGYNRRDMRVKR